MNHITNKKTFASKLTIARAACTCVVAAMTMIVNCEGAFAQDSKSISKVVSYLQKKDANRNGKIEPEEMSENTKGYLSKMGYDPSKTISISKIAAKADKGRKEREQVRKAADLKVPGFGADTKSSTGVRSFSSSDAAGQKTKTYSRSVLDQASQTMERYDRNQDGVMDSSEIERARWGSPKPSVSDLNRDGKLSRTELNERYAAREKAKSDSNSNSRSSGDRRDGDRRDGDRKEDNRRDDDRSREYSRSRSSYGGASRPGSTSSRSASTSTASSSSKSKTVDRGKYEKYAKSLMKTYDSDKDGKLSKTELKKMRRPPVGADTNDDGFVSESEFVDSLSGANKDKDSSGGRVVKSPTVTKRPSSPSRSPSSRSRTSSSLGKLDANGDNQVQMHEFADEWDDELVAEFYEKDKNGDGVITAAEWLSRD